MLLSVLDHDDSSLWNWTKFQIQRSCYKHFISSPARFKVKCAFLMIISSDFRMGKHRDDDHGEDAPYFTRSLRSLRFSSISKWIFSEKTTKKSLSQFEITLTNSDFYQELIDNLQSHCRAKYYRGPHWTDPFWFDWWFHYYSLKVD